MTFNLTTFLFEIVNFVVLAAILYRLIYRPMRLAIDERRAENERARLEAEAMRKQAECEKEQLDAKLQGIEGQRQEILSKASEQASAEKARRLAEAETEARGVREKARQESEQLHKSSLAAMESEAAALGVKLADRLLNQAATSSLNRELTRRLIETLDRTPEAERNQLRRESTGVHAVVTSAESLDESLRHSLTDSLQKLLGCSIDIRFEISATCLSGSRLQIGGHEWDATAAASLEAARVVIAEGSK